MKKNTFLLILLFCANTILAQQAKGEFAYPVIFVHGLTGNKDTWKEISEELQYKGLKKGPDLLFCLNTDNNNFKGGIYASNTDVKFFNTSISSADFYIVNFNVDATGKSYGKEKIGNLSNQAAILKQGWALKRGIEKVLAATGKDKVVLIGHSMGGLACRAYLQNAFLWQPDGKHHVDKIATIGTPHGGSDISGSVFSNIFQEIDERSDAVRDLRNQYYWSETPGVFVNGGKEDPATMKDGIIGFYNHDVDCNNVVGDNIVGLNQKIMPENVHYYSLIGDFVGDNYSGKENAGDGVVSLSSQNLIGNIPNPSKILHEEEMIYDLGSYPLHLKMPHLVKEVLKAMDEPDYLEFAQPVTTGKYYSAFTTKQGVDNFSPSIKDYDAFQFYVPEESTCTVNVTNSFSENFSSAIIKGFSSTNTLKTTSAGIYPSYNMPSITLQKGYHCLLFKADPDDDDSLYPYSFRINLTPTNTVASEDIEIAKNLSIFYPNPNNTGLFSFHQKPNDVKISDAIGRIIGAKIDDFLDLSNQPSGIYFVQWENENGKIIVEKLIKQ